MKSVLCYGDSNTWGFCPQTEGRYGHNERWTRVLQRLLGDEYWVIEEGLNGRTTVHDDPVEGHKSGLAYLVPCLESHKPLDVVVLLLGTNDLKARFAQSARDIGRAIERLVRVVQYSETGPNGSAPRVLLLAPPPLATLTGFAQTFVGAPEKSRGLASEYRGVAEARGCDFLDTGTVIVSSEADGIHFDADQLPKLARAVADFIIM